MGFADKVKNVGNAWDAAREAEAKGNSFDKDEIEDGTYMAELTKARAGESKDGTPYVVFDFTICPPSEENGKVTSAFHYITDSGKRTVQNSLEALFRDIHILDPDFDYHNASPEDVEKVVKELDNTELFVQIGLKTNDKGYQNLYVNKLMDEDSPQPVETNGEFIPGKGELVLFVPPRARTEKEGKVTSVNIKKATCSLKIGTVTHKDVPFNKLSPSVAF